MEVEIDRRAVLSHIADRLRPTFGGPMWLSLAGGARPPGIGAFDRLIVDTSRYAGPLRAMRDVLRVAPRYGVVVFCAGDMPVMSARHVRRLTRELGQQPNAACAMGVWCDGPEADRCEPLPSAWRVDVGLRLLNEAIHHGVRGPSQLVTRRACVGVPLSWATDESIYLNVNRPTDLRRVATSLRKPVLIRAGAQTR